MSAEPEWHKGIPMHSDECGEYDGKRCRAMGFRPSRICEPAVQEIVIESAARLERGERARAWIRRRGVHDADCAVYWRHDEETGAPLLACNCGLDDALSDDPPGKKRDKK